MPDADPLRVYRKLAQANRLANARLHRVCGQLPAQELTKPRPAFFSTIQVTLNHILMVDRFYINALEGGALDEPSLDQALACPDLPTLVQWQAASDNRLITHVTGLSANDLGNTVRVDRGNRVQLDRHDDVLLHLLTHQIHHRGQVHDMLSATPLKPPQLDEFIVGDDAAVRAEDMTRLGWAEADLMR
jgi:uncharacterized damage-inducible protein DinB